MLHETSCEYSVHYVSGLTINDFTYSRAARSFSKYINSHRAASLQDSIARMATFDERVQSLPAEIYNEIYDLTFKTAPSVVYIDKDYWPPALLQANRATRVYPLHKIVRSI